MTQTSGPATPAHTNRQPRSTSAQPSPLGCWRAPERAQHPAQRWWKVVEDAGELLAHPRTRLGLLVLTEVLIVAGGISRPDAALARDAAEALGSITGARRKRPGGPRVIIE